jgi:predicted ribosome quality control (RQC) complex YloA/Tae2 family protein
MYNNYYFLRQISARLREQLIGFTLVSCFSQNKDEIVFEFNNTKRSFFIKADLQGDFSCLTFPESFHRARKNSVDLFNDVLMKKVVGVRQFENERAFEIDLEDNWSVLFKMHGNQSNIVLLKNNEEVDRFRKSVPGGTASDRSIDWSKEAFDQNIGHLEKLYFTFGKQLITKDWNEIQRLRKQLENPKYFIVRDKKITFSLIPQGNVIAQFDDPLVAVNSFYNLFVSTHAFEKEKNSVLHKLQSDINNVRGWLKKTNAKLQELQADEHYKAWGDLLMANLHQIDTGMKSVTVENFYDNNNPVSIPLDQNLSPQKNAERYYRKGKNQQIEVSKLREGLEKKSKDLTKLEGELATAEEATGVRSLPKVEERQSSTTRPVPYREFEFKGYKIWVGKDAKTNDELTLKYSYKEDLWLHVRDDTGSHVLLKHQAGKVFPKDVIEHAASIAAFFSKRRTEPLCAVIVTPKKFVRKRKGDPAGAIVVDREEVRLVEPRAPEARN